jgi:uncharacterized protein YndB with AHSA1/START domain
MPANAKSADSSTPTKPLELTITRTFNAPRELVYKCFTEPEHVMKWGGPRSFVMEKFTQDVRVGGKWRGMLRSTTGKKDLWQGGTFLKIDPPKHVSYTFAWEDENGKPQNETIVTIDLEEVAGFTKLTFRQSGFPTEGERDGHTEGWGEAFDKFAEYFACVPRGAAR